MVIVVLLIGAFLAAVKMECSAMSFVLLLLAPFYFSAQQPEDSINKEIGSHGSITSWMSGYRNSSALFINNLFSPKSWLPRYQ